MSIIQLKNICKSHGSPIIENANLVIDRGDFISITGPSGCGKSTLLQIIGLLDNADSGTYHLMGRDIRQAVPSQQAKLRNKHIGFVFQRYHLLEHLNILDNISLPLTYSQNPPSQLDALAYEQLKRMKLTDKGLCHPSQLSYGQQQRVAIARALITQPDIILADEPTGSLDEENAKHIMGILREFNQQGKTIILITHNLSLIESGDRHYTIANKTLEVCS